MLFFENTKEKRERSFSFYWNCFLPYTGKVSPTRTTYFLLQEKVLWELLLLFYVRSLFCEKTFFSFSLKLEELLILYGNTFNFSTSKA